jgi:hypothetical protein
MGLPPVENHWFSPLLPFTVVFRVAVAIFAVSAGVVALFTDRALVDREKPLCGISRLLKNTPLETRKLSPWGYRILAILFLAGMLQFCGDWLKDKKSDQDNDVKLSRLTKGLGDAVGSAISDANEKNITALKGATKENKESIDNAAGEQTKQVVKNIGDSLQPLIKQQGKISKGTEAAVSSINTVLHKANEELYPFKNVGWSWYSNLNGNNLRTRKILASLGAWMKNRQKSYLKLPSDDSGEEQLDSEIALAVFDSSFMTAEIRDNDGELFYSSVLNAPPNFDQIKVTLDTEFHSTQLVCDVARRTYEDPLCYVAAYPGAPLIHAETQTSKIKYLDQLAGKLLILSTDLPLTSAILRLESICLHVGNEALCYTADDFKPTPYHGKSAYAVQLPPDLDSILKRMIPGTLERTSLSKDGPHILTVPE